MKIGAPTKRLEILICYDLHSRISNKEDDLMFAIKLGLFSIGTIVVPTSVWSNQHVKLITSTSLNLIKHVIKHVEPMFEPPISFDIFVKLVLVRLVKITIPPDSFQQHLLETFFQLEVREMEIDETHARIRVQNLRIMGWTITKKE
jgi:hypothetical protein